MRELTPDILADLDDDAVAELSAAMDADAKVARRNRELCTWTLQVRLRERGATHLDTEHWHGRLVPGRLTYSVADPEGLRRALGDHLTPAQLDAVIPIPDRPVPIHKGLTDLSKLGGPAAEIIDAYREPIRSDPQIELKRKADVDLEPDQGADDANKTRAVESGASYGFGDGDA